jgi:2-hydroxychromene-2-carboxylate isomerase
MVQIDYYFSTISSYAYLAGMRLQAIAARHGASIRYRPVDMMGLYARTGGKPVAERHPARQEHRPQVHGQSGQSGRNIGCRILHGLPLWPDCP